MLEWVANSPFLPVVGLSAATAAAFALLIAFSRIGALGAVAAPAAFLVAYYATYQKVPPFPPAGAANKVFYVGLFAAIAGVAASLALLSLAYLRAPRGLPDAALLSVGAGLLGLVDAIALVSRHADVWALALVAISPLLGRYAVRFVAAEARFAPVWTWLASGLATLSPLVAIVALLFWRHDSPL